MPLYSVPRHIVVLSADDFGKIGNDMMPVQELPLPLTTQEAIGARALATRDPETDAKLVYPEIVGSMVGDILFCKVSGWSATPIEPATKNEEHQEVAHQ